MQNKLITVENVSGICGSILLLVCEFRADKVIDKS